MKLALFLSLFLVSCGYRWVPDYPSASKPTITVPFIAGDEDGSFTTEVIRVLSASGLADVRHVKGDYRLEIVITESESETIGYRYDREKIAGEVTNNLIASEGRKALSVEATLFEGDSERIAYGPYKISASADYDYVDGDSFQDLTFLSSSGERVTVLPFSLGQLESVESAQEAALKPLYSQIAQKVVDVISSEW